MAENARNEVLNLMTKKDQIEKEIRQMNIILQQNGISMNDPLVDAQGFPLSHVDVYQVRLARNQIICLQNDHKAVMKQIETGLGHYYSSTSDVQISSSTSAPSNSRADYSQLVPFAKISNVVSGSPADEAGLQNNDLLLEFGSVKAENYKDITTIAEIVRHSENIDIFVRIRRDTRNTTVQLRPRKWSGNGLLGCLISTYEVVDR